jgi:hypothetical protein
MIFYLNLITSSKGLLHQCTSFAFFQKKAKTFAGREDRFKVIDLAMTPYLLSELTGNSITEGNLAQICLQRSEGDDGKWRLNVFQMLDDMAIKKVALAIFKRF